METDFDLSRYMGLWNEIARLPSPFEQGCVGATALYTLQEDGTVEVRNTCLGDAPREVVGRAYVPDPDEPFKLVVEFPESPVPGDYWILALDMSNYQWAVVGGFLGEFLWILARAETLFLELLDQLVQGVADLGYPVDQLEWSPAQSMLIASATEGGSGTG